MYGSHLLRLLLLSDLDGEHRGETIGHRTRRRSNELRVAEQGIDSCFAGGIQDRIIAIAGVEIDAVLLVLVHY